MENGLSTNNNTIATLQGTGLVPQIFMGALMIVILYIVCVMIELL